jgi:hypothetical protein
MSSASPVDADRPRTLSDVAAVAPDLEVGVSRVHNRKSDIWHRVGDNHCKTSRERLRTATAAELAARGFGHYRECRNCRQSLSDRSESDGYDERDCPLCGTTVKVLSDHLPACDGDATEVQYVR